MLCADRFKYMPFKYGKKESIVIKLLLERASIDEISERLGICRKTVDTHIANIKTKCGRETRKEIREFFAKNGYGLLNQISLETEIEIFETWNVNKNNHSLMSNLADRLGISRTKIYEIITKFKKRNFTVINSSPVHDSYTVSFGRIENV